MRSRKSLNRRFFVGASLAGAALAGASHAGFAQDASPAASPVG